MNYHLMDMHLLIPTEAVQGVPFLFLVKQGRLEKNMEIRLKTPELLEEALEPGQRENGSIWEASAIPLMSGNRNINLSEQCLKVIDQYQIPLLITTSAVSPALLEEAEILKNMKAPVVVVAELARIPEMERLKKEGIHKGIQAANILKKMGLTVWATMAPVCPGILDLEPVLEKLDEEIPVYIDSLQCAKGSIQEKRVRNGSEKIIHSWKQFMKRSFWKKI